MLIEITSHKFLIAKLRASAKALVRKRITESAMRSGTMSALGAPPRKSWFKLGMFPPAGTPIVPVPWSRFSGSRFTRGVDRAWLRTLITFDKTMFEHNVLSTGNMGTSPPSMWPIRVRGAEKSSCVSRLTIVSNHGQNARRQCRQVRRLYSYLHPAWLQNMDLGSAPQNQSHPVSRTPDLRSRRSKSGFRQTGTQDSSMPS